MKKIIITTAVIFFSMAGIADAAPDSNSIIRNGIEYYIQTDKAVYHLGENVEMLYRVTNLGSEEVTFGFPGSPEWNFWVERDGENIWTAVEGWYWFGSGFTLAPSEYKEYPYLWDMRDHENNLLVNVGGYSVIGGLDGAATEFYDFTRISVGIEIVPEPAKIYYVNAAEGSDNNDGLSPQTPFATIQKAIDSAFDGDEIKVAAGTYYENINFAGKDVILRSTDPMNPSVVAGTIIDGSQGGSVVTFAGTESAACVLSGFTVTNGRGTGVGLNCGGGIYGNGTLATIQYNIISGNRTLSPLWPNSGYGGGLYDCDGTIQYNIISRNQASCNEGGASGGGLYGCDGIIQYNLISANSMSGFAGWGGFEGAGLSNCNGIIQNNVISGNYASGWFVDPRGGGLSNCNGIIQNNTIFGNYVEETRNGFQDYGGGLSSCSGTIRNCIIWQNSADAGAQLYASSIPSYSCIQDWTGGGIGNISNNPCFVLTGYWDPNGTPDVPWDDFWVDGDYHLLRTSPCIDAANDANVYTDIEGNIRPFDFPGVDNNGELPEFDMGAYEAMVSCFGVNHVKLGTKAGKKGNKVEVKGTFDPALPIDFAVDDVTYTIDDGLDYLLTFIIPADSFKPEGKPDKQKFKFHSAKGSQPGIKARFDFLKCKFELKVKGVIDTSEITADTLAIVLQAGENPANLVEEVVQVQAKPKHLEFKREPKLNCCPKCKGIALLEVTSDQGVFVFEPEPGSSGRSLAETGKEKLKAKTVVDDGVNGPVKIDTSCSKPLEVGDVFGAYTVTALIKIFDDCPGGCFDLVDFAMLAARWMETGCGDCNGADLTGEGDVDLDDLQVLFDGWLLSAE